MSYGLETGRVRCRGGCNEPLLRQFLMVKFVDTLVCRDLVQIGIVSSPMENWHDIQFTRRHISRKRGTSDRVRVRAKNKNAAVKFLLEKLTKQSAGQGFKQYSLKLGKVEYFEVFCCGLNAYYRVWRKRL